MTASFVLILINASQQDESSKRYDLQLEQIKERVSHLCLLVRVDVCVCLCVFVSVC